MFTLNATKWLTLLYLFPSLPLSLSPFFFSFTCYSEWISFPLSIVFDVGFTCLFLFLVVFLSLSLPHYSATVVLFTCSLSSSFLLVLLPIILLCFTLPYYSSCGYNRIARVNLLIAACTYTRPSNFTHLLSVVNLTDGSLIYNLSDFHSLFLLLMFSLCNNWYLSHLASHIHFTWLSSHSKWVKVKLTQL